MTADLTIDVIRALASANGLTIPEERLPLVLREYQSYLRTLDSLDALDLPRETEPATIFALPEEIAQPRQDRQPRR